MSETLIRRNSADLAEEILSDTPVLSVSGARQVGKTTLVSQLIKNRPVHAVNLDDAATLAAAKGDPDAFARQNPGGTLAIDEIQRAPELFRAIKGALEEDRRPGRFIIIGSSNLSTLKGAEESLTGRAETLYLRPFRLRASAPSPAASWSPSSPQNSLNSRRGQRRSSSSTISEAPPDKKWTSSSKTATNRRRHRGQGRDVDLSE